MAASISELTSEYLFYVGELHPDSYNKQREWLFAEYVKYREAGDAEVTNVSFQGGASTTQFRGASNEDHRLALKAAVEQIKALQEGQNTTSQRKPFGFRFNSPPAVELESLPGLTSP